jgi:hypothetical protein
VSWSAPERQPCGNWRDAGFGPMYGRSLAPPSWRVLQMSFDGQFRPGATSVSSGITSRHTGLSGEGPHTALSDVGDPRQSATLSHGFAPWGQIRRCSAPRPDGHSVGSASPDSGDLTRSTSSLAKTAGRIVSSRRGPVPRDFGTRANSSARAAASSGCAVRGS